MNSTDFTEERMPLDSKTKTQKDLSRLITCSPVVWKVIGVASLMLVFFLLLTFLINKSI